MHIGAKLTSGGLVIFNFMCQLTEPWLMQILIKHYSGYLYEGVGNEINIWIGKLSRLIVLPNVSCPPLNSWVLEWNKNADAPMNEREPSPCLTELEQFLKFIFFYWRSIFPGSSAGKESICNAGDPGSGRSAREGIGYPLQYSWASLVGQLVKNPPAMGEAQVQSLGWEDPLEKGMLPTPVFWLGEFHGPYSSWGRKESDTTEWMSL